MIRIRPVVAALVGASLMSLAACAGDDATTASSAPTTTAPAAPAATTEAAAPAGDAPDDKTICKAAGAADKTMKKELLSALQAAGGDLDGAGYAKVLNGLATTLTTAAGSSETEVGQAVKAFAAKATEGATAAKTAADPTTVLDGPEFAKSGTDLTAACKAAGVTVNY